MLTRKQYELLMFIHERVRESGIPPSFDEMKEALDLKSKSGIHRLITALEERGFLRRMEKRARALEVLKLPDNMAETAAPRHHPQPGVIVVKHLGGAALKTAPMIAADYSNTRDLGVQLFTRYAYPAQIAAVILLVASIAAIVLTLRQRKGGKPQDIAKQVAVRAKDRVRIVKMASEKRP